MERKDRQGFGKSAVLMRVLCECGGGGGEGVNEENGMFLGGDVVLVSIERKEPWETEDCQTGFSSPCVSGLMLTQEPQEDEFRD